MAEASGTSRAVQFSSVLSNDTLARVERLRINSNRMFTALARGEHRASRRGMSTEFRDFRPYVEGDDTRFLDWNIFARLHKPYLRQFYEEQEQHVVVLIDGSASMGFEGKIDRAKSLAAAFGVMGLMAGERVSVYAFHGDGDQPEVMRPVRGRASIRSLLSFIERVGSGGDRPLERGIESFTNQHSGRGVAVVVSDFMTVGDLKRAFNRLYSTGLELFAIHVMSPTELAPELSGDLRLVDVETDATLDVSNVGQLLEIYHQYREALEANLSKMASQRGGRYLRVAATDATETIIFDTMRRRGWVR